MLAILAISKGKQDEMHLSNMICFKSNPILINFLLVGAQLQLSTGNQSITGQRNHVHTLEDNLQTPVNLTVMFCECGRKTGSLEGAHACTVEATILYEERS